MPRDSTVNQLLVLGATGVMGVRLVALARRLLPGVAVLRGWRHARPDREPDARAVDLHDPASLRAALAGVAAVINAVGPFDYDPAPVVRTCLEAGCHYVDIAETPEFIDRVETAATPGRACALSGCSTVPGLVRVLAQHWAGRPDVRQVRVFLGMGSRNPVSPALLYSLLQPLTGRAPDASRYFGRLRRKRLRRLPARLYGRYPSAFDRHGIRLGDRVLPATFYAGFDRGYLGYVLCAAARLVPRLPPEQLRSLCRLAQPSMPLVQALGTPVGVLSIEGLDGSGRVATEIEVRAAREGLTVPALPAVWAIRRLLDPEPLSPAAPLRLEHLLTAEQAAAWLQEAGCRVAAWNGRA
jgi:hypothetical protein